MAAVWSSGANHPLSGPMAGGGGWASVLSCYSYTAHKYNNVSWAATGSPSTQHTLGSRLTGTSNTDILSITGKSSSPYAVEMFNGSTWSTTTSYPLPRWDVYVCGTSFAALVAGGYMESSQVANNVYTFNGSTFSSQGGTLVSRADGGCFGSSTAARIAAGVKASAGGGYETTASMELYNGITWAAGSDYPVAMRFIPGDGASSGLMCGGLSGYGGSTITAAYTYTSAWVSAGTMLSPRYSHGLAAAQPEAGVAFCGAATNPTTYHMSTEHYADTIPNAFGFTSVVDVNLDTVVTSNIVAPSDYGVPVGWSVSGAGSPLASIAGGAWTTSGTITPGQTVQLRVTSATTYSTARTVALNIGGVTGSWTITTRRPPVPQIMWM